MREMTILRALKANAQPAFVTSRTEEFVILGQRSEQMGYKFLRPQRLGSELADIYESAINHIFDLYSGMLPRVVGHIRATQQQPDGLNQAEWQALSMHMGAAAVGNMLPLSALVYRNTDGPVYRDLPQSARATIQEIIAPHLPSTFSSEAKPTQLLSVEPRSELELVREILFENTNQSVEEVEDAFDNLRYEERKAILAAYKKGKHVGPALRKLRYEFEVTESLMMAREIQYFAPGVTTTYQEFTPRHGYAVPDIIEQAGETENFERAFDLSYQLYAAIQSANKPEDAELAVLLGHRTRWRLSTDHFTLHAKPHDSPELTAFLSLLRQTVEAQHQG